MLNGPKSECSQLPLLDVYYSKLGSRARAQDLGGQDKLPQTHWHLHSLCPSLSKTVRVGDVLSSAVCIPLCSMRGIVLFSLV